MIQDRLIRSVTMKEILKVTALTTIMLASVEMAVAAAPAVKTQPGFYRLMVGDFEITALNDGVVPYQTTRVLPTATPEQIRADLSQNGLSDPVGMSFCRTFNVNRVFFACFLGAYSMRKASWGKQNSQCRRLY
jgi:hypothetical protein